MAGSDANIIFGAMYDEGKQDEATITIIATGLDSQMSAKDAKIMQQSVKPMGNYNYKPTNPIHSSMGEIGPQPVKPNINFDVPTPKPRNATENIQIPTFLQKKK